MKIINLMENIQGKQDVLSEHGLSFYVEAKGHKLLVDCGQTASFIENANRLQVDLEKIDTVILSHGHYDHSGGILSFAEINPHAKIYLQKSAVLPYYHKTEDEERYIGIDPAIKELSQVEFV